jgi:hypothetical protein
MDFGCCVRIGTDRGLFCFAKAAQVRSDDIVLSGQAGQIGGAAWRRSPKAAPGEACRAISPLSKPIDSGGHVICEATRKTLIRTS